MWSAMPASLVRSTETLPSSRPGMIRLLIQLIEQSPVITPTQKFAGPSLFGVEFLSVPSSLPAGPLSFLKIHHEPSLSTTSLPWFGGPSITTRPSCGIACRDK